MLALYIDWKFHLLQQMRVVHAITEADVSVSIPLQERWKFRQLEEAFPGMFANTSSDAVNVTSAVRFSHAEPKTQVGSSVRPLVFPVAIALKCRELWPKDRHVAVSFQGLMTSDRRTAIARWIGNDSHGTRPKILQEPSVWRRLYMAVKRKSGLTSSVAVTVGPLVINSSDRGRVFPLKAWDLAYYKLLSDSRFTLCPSGDFTWSYRFFEAALCGSIPVVQEICSVYQGFRYYTFADRHDEMVWRSEDAEANYELALARLTIPRDELNDVLRSIAMAAHR